MKIDDYKWNIQPKDYGPLADYVFMDDITDVDYNGKDIWVCSLDRGRYRLSNHLDSIFVDQFCNRVANMVSKPFNKNNPVIEAETTDLRITIVHSSVAYTGTAICIRKTPIKMRLSEKFMIESKYCSKEVIYLLGNCVRAGLSIAVCGGMGCGKTELIKFLSRYIPDNEKSITMEDTLEVHFRQINPRKDCVEFKVDKRIFSYENALKTSLRMNAEWLILSEARSKEVKYLLENMSVGTGCLTTLHAQDVRKIPDRIINMYPDEAGLDRVENDIYSFLNVGVHVQRKQSEDKSVLRYVDQICFFTRDDNRNKVTLIMDEQKFTNTSLPESIRKKMNFKNIVDPFLKL